MFVVLAKETEEYQGLIQKFQKEKAEEMAAKAHSTSPSHALHLKNSHQSRSG